MKTILITNNEQKGFQEALDVTLEELEKREVKIIDIKFSSSSFKNVLGHDKTDWSALIVFQEDKELDNGRSVG